MVALLVVAASPAWVATGAAASSNDQSSSVAVASDGGDNATTLTVLTYNDIQTAASDPGAMGRLVGVLNERRAAHDNPTVVVGGGDEVSPSSLAPLSQWEVPVRVLNVADPAAEAVGNHDLDYGFDAVANYSNASTFPWLAANVVDADTGAPIPGANATTTVTRGDVTVGIVGLADEAIKPKTAVDFEEQGYEVRDFVEVGRTEAQALKADGADVVIATAHIGVPEAKTLAANTSAIDVIVVGDDEIRYPPQVVNGTVIVEAEARAAYVGEVNLTVTDDGVSFADGRLIPAAGNETAPVNVTAAEIVNRSRDRYLDEVVGETTVPLDSTFASNYHDETRWGNLVTDAFLRVSDTGTVAITNAGGIRGNFVIDEGNVTYDDVYTSLPFGNTLVTKRLNGTELRALLASQVVTLESETGQQYGAEPALQVSGVTYEYVPHEGADPVIRDVYVDGEPLDPDREYAVTVNSYMAGWDRLAAQPTVSRNLTLYGTAAALYVRSESPVSPPATNRIRRVDTELDPVRASVDDETVRVRVAVPDRVRSIEPATVRLENETVGRVAAESASLNGSTLTATFDRAAVRDLARASDTVQLYGAYADATYADQRVYFNRSVLNAEVQVPAPSTPTPTPTRTASPTATATPTQSPPTVTDGPGFGVLVALVGLLVALAGRRP